MCLWFLITVLAGTGAPGQELSSGRVAAFQFGAPTSAARTGFTKVTTEDVFAAEKGYGFQATQGLTVSDRGGSAIVLPEIHRLDVRCLR